MMTAKRNETIRVVYNKADWNPLSNEIRIIATQRGYQYFNLDGGLIGSTEDSLCRFKISFSKDFNFWKYMVNESVYNDLTINEGNSTVTHYFPGYWSPNNFNHAKT